MADCFIAEIRMVGFTFTPVFWATCNGGLVSISQNSAVFALIGTHYGGDGRVSMGLPNLIGRSPLHYGASTGPGQPPYVLGEKGGLEKVIMNHTNLPVHKHEIYTTFGNSTDLTDVATTATNLANPADGSRPYLNNPPGSGTTLTALEMLKHNGANVGAANQQPFLTTNFIMALEGTFPARN